MYMIHDVVYVFALNKPIRSCSWHICCNQVLKAVVTLPGADSKLAGDESLFQCVTESFSRVQWQCTTGKRLPV